MAVHKSVMVTCDGCDDVYPLDMFTPGTAADHRRYLRSQGWRTNLPGGRDLCAKCVATSRGQDS